MSVGDLISATMGCDVAYESIGRASDIDPKKFSFSRFVGSTISPTSVARYCANPLRKMTINYKTVNVGISA